MKFLRFLFLIFFILFSQNVFAENKIVFIDIDFLIKNSNIGKSSLKKLEELNKKNVNLLNNNEKELKEKENKLLQKKNIISK